MMRALSPKDPTDVTFYEFDFKGETNGTAQHNEGDFLEDDETISEIISVTAPDGLTVDSSSLTKSDTAIRVWLSGGTANMSYGVTATVQTSVQRTIQRTMKVYVKEL